jgi:molecular chaperone HscB
MNYFEFYELPVSFNVDKTLVKRKFYELSKKYHPDFYVNDADEKQAEILELSTINNKAFQVLSNPGKRIAYILELHGLLVEGEKYQLPQAFLMEMMEVNEALMELEFDEGEGDSDEILEQVEAIEQELEHELSLFTGQFDQQDEMQRTESLKEIKDIWYRQKYLLRIRDSLNKFASRI